MPASAERRTVSREAAHGTGVESSSRRANDGRVANLPAALDLLCSPDGLPVGFELAPANAPERLVAAELLARVLAGGETVNADEGFAGAEFEQHATLGGRLLRPDRKGEQPRFG